MERKNLQITYLTKNLYPEYTKTQKTTVKSQPNLKIGKRLKQKLMPPNKIKERQLSTWKENTISFGWCDSVD